MSMKEYEDKLAMKLKSKIQVEDKVLMSRIQCLVNNFFILYEAREQPTMYWLLPFLAKCKNYRINK
jgi:hypothetical protein